MARPRQISDAQILATMRSSVISHGPNVPLDTVAARLGVTAPALLKRFGNRETLMLEALRPRPKPEWIEALLKGPNEAPLEAQLIEIFTQVHEFLSEAIPCMSALRESGISHSKIFASPSMPTTCVKAIEHWLEAARAKGLVLAPETETAAVAMFGAIQSRAFLSHVAQHDFSVRSQKRHLVELASFFGRALTATTRTIKRTRTRTP